jgi:RNA polymerase sigma-70 factor (ECF subfamily)
LLGRECRPSEVAVRAELKIRLQEALNRMDPIDREVLSLRHFEQLTTVETASLDNHIGNLTWDPDLLRQDDFTTAG